MLKPKNKSYWGFSVSLFRGVRDSVQEDEVKQIDVRKQNILYIHTHKDGHCPLRDPYFGRDSEEEGGCRHSHWPVSLDQTAGMNQQRHDIATMELSLPGMF